LRGASKSVPGVRSFNGESKLILASDKNHGVIRQDNQSVILIPILVDYYLLPRCKFGHFGTYYFYVHRH